MHRKALDLASSLREFVGQPDYSTLLLSGSDASMTFPNRILSALDRQDEDHYYLVFPEPFHSASKYVDGIASSLQMQLDVMNAHRRDQGAEAWPALPLELVDQRYPVDKRLRAAIDYAAAQLSDGALIVWGLLPAELTDTPGYQAMILPLLALQELEPWMERHRFIVRDHPPALSLVPLLYEAKNDRVLVQEIDFSTEQAHQSLTATALDKQRSPDERVDAFMQLAALDLAHKRYVQAIEKYGACFNYFHDKGDAQQATLCLTGTGDVLMQSGHAEQALTKYQQSLAVSVPAQNLPLILSSLMGAGAACLVVGDVAQAAGYYDYASQTAGKLLNPYAKCDAMEKQGVALWRLGKISECIDLWLKTKQLSQEVHYVERTRSVLDHLIVVCDKAGLGQRVRQFEAEKAQVASSCGMGEAQP